MTSGENTQKNLENNTYGPTIIKGKSGIKDDKKPEITNEYGLKVK